MSTTYSGNSVAITSSTDASPIVVRAIAHGRSTADVVNIAGHLINTFANGEWAIVVVDADHFSLTGSAAQGAGAGGATGTVTAFVSSLTIPSGGDLRNAASVNVFAQGLADRVQMLYRDYKQRLLGQFPLVPAHTLIGRTQNHVPFFKVGDWAVDPAGNSNVEYQSASGGKLLLFPLKLPHGCLFTNFYVVCKGNASPATPMSAAVYTEDASTPAGFAFGTLSGADAASVSFHHMVSTGTEMRIDNASKNYWLGVASESGAGSGTSHVLSVYTYHTMNALNADGG